MESIPVWISLNWWNWNSSWRSNNSSSAQFTLHAIVAFSEKHDFRKYERIGHERTVLPQRLNYGDDCVRKRRWFPLRPALYSITSTNKCTADYQRTAYGYGRPHLEQIFAISPLNARACGVCVSLSNCNSAKARMDDFRLLAHFSLSTENCTNFIRKMPCIQWWNGFTRSDCGGSSVPKMQTQFIRLFMQSNHRNSRQHIRFVSIIIAYCFHYRNIHIRSVCSQANCQIKKSGM